jgi:xylulokinase
MDWLAGILAPLGGAPPAVAQLLDEAAHEPAGARGLLFVPHVNGTRMPTVDPAASGAFVGLRPWHTRASLARAVVEGVALALREGLEASRAAGIPIRRVRLAGGAQRHPLWARVQADAFGVPVELGAAENASVLGAAMLAAIGSGALASFAAAAALVAQPDVDPIEPDPAATALYTERAALLRTVTRQLRPTSRALAEDASPEDAGH